MRITNIKTYKFSVPTQHRKDDAASKREIYSKSKPWLFLKIETDAGISGWGEGTGEWLVPMVEATLHDWAVLLEGQDPTQVAALTEDISNRSPWKGGPVFGTAIAAINAALYDIAGKAWGVPVTTILGGAQRQRVQVYGHGMRLSSPEAALESVQQLVDAGHRAGKGNPLETRTWPMDHEAVELTTACVAAIRETAGDDFEILLDAHGSPTPELSLALAHKIAPYRPLFLEEPVKVGSIEALEEVSRKSPVPIATGEKLFTADQFKELTDRRSCAYLQPDLVHSFGITHMLWIARLAEMSQMLMAPHNAGGPLHLAATLSFDAVIPNFLIQEMSEFWFNMFPNYVEHDWVVADGYISMTDRPGLGLEVKEQDIAKLPYEPMPYRQYRHDDGSWKGW
ncbi:MAG: hypothetical protein CMJ49_13615 [Planctomycetaceae bacterium]|nr:hypothetical protein [Planctomycetaceae bacterium]